MYMQSKISLISRNLIYVDPTSLFPSILNRFISSVNLTFCMTSDFGYILSLLFRQIGRRSKDFFQILNWAKTDAMIKYQRFKICVKLQ